MRRPDIIDLPTVEPLLPRFSARASTRAECAADARTARVVTDLAATTYLSNRDRRFDETRPGLQIRRDILGTVDFLGKSVAPCFETVDPRVHGVLVDADFPDFEAGAPAVVCQRLHRRVCPS